MMYSEENERLAEAAFARYRTQHDASLPEWASYPAKHAWRDLVNTFQAVQRSHSAIANPMEQCVSDALLGAADAPAVEPEPVKDPENPKPTKRGGR